jgi:hypothetical protein
MTDDEFLLHYYLVSLGMTIFHELMMIHYKETMLLFSQKILVSSLYCHYTFMHVFPVLAFPISFSLNFRKKNNNNKNNNREQKQVRYVIIINCDIKLNELKISAI